MKLQSGDKVMWTDPDRGQTHLILIKQVYYQGSVICIEKGDGGYIEVYEHELDVDVAFPIEEEQINPKPTEKPTRHGRLKV